MKHQGNYRLIAVALTLALLMPACGNPSSTTSSTAANVTFKTDPIDVQVWVDGKERGTTPVVIALEAGEHEVTFKRDGYEDVKDALKVEAGKDLTVTTALAVTGDEQVAFKTLLAALGIPAHENQEGKVHRAAMKNGVMLYWPQKNVRKEGLLTYRLELADDYEDDGFIEFRKGREILHREPLKVESAVTEKRLPASVMESLKRGSSITWGVYFDDKKKKNVTAKFKVTDGRGLDRKLAKLERRSVYRRAGPLERELAKIELKRNYRYYTEALTDAMSVLNTWPETQMADKVIVDSLQRLDLKESMLYVEIMKRVRGGGKHAGKAKAGGGLGKVGSAPLPETLVAPKVARPTADAGGSKPGLKAGGMGVTPTPDAQKRKPGPIAAPGTAQPGDTGKKVGDDTLLRRQADARERKEHAEELARQLRGALDELERAEEAEKEWIASETAEREASDAAQALRDKQTQTDSDAARLSELNDKGTLTPEEQTEKDALQTRVDAASASAEADRTALREAEARAERLRAENEGRAREAAGSRDAAGAARRRVDELRRQLDEAKEPLPHEAAPPGVAGETPPGVEPIPADRVDDDPLADSASRRGVLATPEQMRAAGQAVEAAERAHAAAPTPETEAAVEAARVALARLSGAPQSDPRQAAAELTAQRSEQARLAVEDAQRAVETARTAFEAAEAALEAAETSGDADAIREAERVYQDAANETSRANMEVERAEANRQALDQEVTRSGR